MDAIATGLIPIGIICNASAKTIAALWITSLWYQKKALNFRIRMPSKNSRVASRIS